MPTLRESTALTLDNRLGVSTPTWDPMHAELGFSYATLTDSYAVGSAALCFGVILFMPFALKFGRRPAYILSTILQVGVSVWASKIHTVADLMLINAFNCFLGSLAEAVVQMTIADMFFVHRRGVMTSIYVWVFIIASSLAPVATGYITAGQGWRWVWNWVTILLGVCFVLFFLSMRKQSIRHWFKARFLLLPPTQKVQPLCHRDNTQTT